MCGVFGAFSASRSTVIEDIYLGLYALQHRGQESAGIAWCDPEGTMRVSRSMGLVHDALKQDELASIDGHAAIGHVRYPMTGSLAANTQPLIASYAKGQVAIAHNGNITNADSLKASLQGRGAIFQSTSDTEVILHLMAHQAHKPPLDALMSALLKLQGAYSLAVLLDQRLVAARDPWGVRPLALGRRDNIWYISSESCAFSIVGAKFERDIAPGEVLIIDENGPQSLFLPHKPKRLHICSFEYVYFARPDSVIDGVDVYSARKRLGQCLAKRCPAKADFVTGMPDSGTISAMGYAEAAKLPYEKVIVRNRYVGRTFIQPTQRVRDLGVHIKLSPVSSMISDRSVLIVDDSLVRGTTAARMLTLIRESKPKAIHLRIASPPVLFPCYYGIDTPSSEELAATRSTVAELGHKVSADSLAYLTLEDLVEAIGLPGEHICSACFSGDYIEESDYATEL